MTRGEREAIKQYISDILDTNDVQLEVRDGRVFLIDKQDLGDAEIVLEEAWEWRAGVERGNQQLL